MKLSQRQKIWAVVWVALAGLILVIWCVVAINDKKEQQVLDGSIDVSDSVSLTWVDSFTKRDFASCDMLVENQNNRFYAPLVLTHARDRRYYEKALNGMVDCIRAVSLISVEDGSYKVKISLVPYQPVSGFDVESAASVRGSYLDGLMPDVDFTNKLQSLYYDVFEESCFVPGEELVDIVVTLSEAEVNGSMYVLGTVDLVDLVLQESGLRDNFAVFESDIKSEVDALLKAGFDE